jgi:hypothetical protein
VICVMAAVAIVGMLGGVAGVGASFLATAEINTKISENELQIAQLERTNNSLWAVLQEVLRP